MSEVKNLAQQKIAALLMGGSLIVLSPLLRRASLPRLRVLEGMKEEQRHASLLGERSGPWRLPGVRFGIKPVTGGRSHRLVCQSDPGI